MHATCSQPAIAKRGRSLARRLILVWGTVAAAQGCAHAPPAKPLASDGAWWHHDSSALTVAATSYSGWTRSSRYVPMRDGTRIAIDVYLPRGIDPAEHIPTILQQTRYYRSLEFRWPFSRWLDRPGFLIEPFVRRGYAVVVADVRGSGASFGRRTQEWSPEEVHDGAELVEWIIRQPWSNGEIGAFGASYGGTAAELLLVNEHPAVKAIVPAFAAFDIYTDIGLPGGVHLDWFTKNWSDFNGVLDRNELPAFLGGKARLALKGVRAVDDDRGRRALADAVQSHATSYDIHAEATRIVFRDDTTSLGWTIDAMSPAARRAITTRTGVPVYSYSGWFDGAYPRAAINRYLNLCTPGSRLILGPWNHGGFQNVSPFGPARQSRFPHLREVIRFFDRYLKQVDRGIAQEKPVHYFTMGEERWKAADSWPPRANETRYYFAAGHALAMAPPAAPNAYDSYTVDTTATTGPTARWNSLMDGRWVDYGDRRAEDQKLLTYTSPPLEEDIEITGHPIVTLAVSSSATDGTFFVYLEEVDETGRVTYVTEGMLRAIHRKLDDGAPLYATMVPSRTFRRADAQPLAPGEVALLTFDLLPTSYLFKAGRSIRVAIAGADRGHFVRLAGPPPTIRVHRSTEHPSSIVLPIIPQGSPAAMLLPRLTTDSRD